MTDHTSTGATAPRALLGSPRTPVLPRALRRAAAPIRPDRRAVLSAAMHKTLIVTNDFPPRPGGIQAFLHSMALRLDPSRVVVYTSTWKRGGREGAEATAAFDAEQPFTVVRDRTYDDAAAHSAGDQACLLAARGARLPRGVVRGRRTSRADGARAAQGRRRADRRHHARPRGGLGTTPRGARSAAQDRRGHRHPHLPRRLHPPQDRRSALPRSRGADGATAARRRREDLPPRLGRRRGPGPAGPDRPARGRVRLTTGAPQGAGHPHRGHAPGAGGRTRRGAADRRRRPPPHRPGAAGRRPRPHRRRALHRPGRLGGAARALRRGRRVRDAVPHPARRAGRGGARHRLPGGVRDRTARRRRRLRRRTGRRAGRRDRPRRPRRQPRADRGPPGRTPPRPRAAHPDGRPGGRRWVEERWRWDLLAERLRELL